MVERFGSTGGGLKVAGCVAPFSLPFFFYHTVTALVVETGASVVVAADVVVTAGVVVVVTADVVVVTGALEDVEVVETLDEADVVEADVVEADVVVDADVVDADVVEVLDEVHAEEVVVLLALVDVDVVEVLEADEVVVEL